MKRRRELFSTSVASLGETVDSRILEIVFCLMDYAQDSGDDMDDMSEYSSSLRNLGFTENEISTAYNWILGHTGAPGYFLD